MKNTNNFRIIAILVSFIVTLLLDQVTKIWARVSLGDQTLQYLGNTIVIQHSENTGAFLSLGADLNPALRFMIFTIGVLAFSVGALIYLFRKNSMSTFSSTAYSLCISGGAGNLIDRIMKGSVTDFINMGIGNVRTGIFNVADMAIMLGVGLLFWDALKTKKQ